MTDYIELNDDSDGFELPSQKEKRKRKAQKFKPKITEKEKKKLKFWTIVLFILLIYLFYELILSQFQELLKLNPTIYQAYLSIQSEIANNTVKGLFFVAIFGSVFFLTLPSEALFIYFLSSTSHPPFIIILGMLFGNLVGLSFNYFFGWLMKGWFLEKLFSKNYDKYSDIVNKKGAIILFVGNIFPGPVEALTVFYGGFRFQFSKYIYFCLMGRLIKYSILFCLYFFYWDSITILYDDIVDYGLSFWRNL